MTRSLSNTSKQRKFTTKQKDVKHTVFLGLEGRWPWPSGRLTVNQGAGDNAKEVLRGQIMKNLVHHAKNL